MCLTHGHNTERSCTVFPLVRFKPTLFQFPIFQPLHHFNWTYPTRHLLNTAHLNTDSISHYKILQEGLAGWHPGTEPVKGPVADKNEKEIRCTARTAYWGPSNWKEIRAAVWRWESLPAQSQGMRSATGILWWERLMMATVLIFLKIMFLHVTS